MLPIPAAAADLGLIAGELARFDDANPVAPRRIDASMRAWWAFAAAFARTIGPHLTDGAELIILPGRRLASAPLAAAGWPGSPLIASRPVSICPNLRILLSSGTPARSGTAGVVAVPKLGDGRAFRTLLYDTARQIAGSRPPGR